MQLKFSTVIQNYCYYLWHMILQVISVKPPDVTSLLRCRMSFLGHTPNFHWNLFLIFTQKYLQIRDFTPVKPHHYCLMYYTVFASSSNFMKAMCVKNLWQKTHCALPLSRNHRSKDAVLRNTTSPNLSLYIHQERTCECTETLWLIQKRSDWTCLQNYISVNVICRYLILQININKYRTYLSFLHGANRINQQYLYLELTDANFITSDSAALVFCKSARFSNIIPVYASTSMSANCRLFPLPLNSV